MAADRLTDLNRPPWIGPSSAAAPVIMALNAPDPPLSPVRELCARGSHTMRYMELETEGADGDRSGDAR
jgi:hypothetical protein